MDAPQRVVAVASALLISLVMCVSCEESAGPPKLRFIADIVAIETDRGDEYVLAMNAPRDGAIVGAIFVRQPHRPGWTNAHLIVKLNDKIFSNEDDLKVWRGRLRDLAVALRAQGDGRAARAAEALERYASLPPQPSE